MKKQGYEKRTYRSLCQSDGLKSFNVTVRETDLYISACTDLHEEACKLVTDIRKPLEIYLDSDPQFLTSLSPIPARAGAPEIVREMIEAGNIMGVGPMAAVAGAIAEKVAKGLQLKSPVVIVENGGDIYICSDKPVITGIYAGNSALSMKVGIEIDPAPTGVSICTSSGKVGHSLSFGNADSVTIIASKGAIADAAATAVCNMVKREIDVDQALAFARKYGQLMGVVIIIDNKIGFYGEKLKLVSI